MHAHAAPGEDGGCEGAVPDDLELHGAADGFGDAVGAAQGFEFESVLRAGPVEEAGFEGVS